MCSLHPLLTCADILTHQQLIRDSGGILNPLVPTGRKPSIFLSNLLMDLMIFGISSARCAQKKGTNCICTA